MSCFSGRHPTNLHPSNRSITMKISTPILHKLLFLSLLIGFSYQSHAQKVCKTAISAAQFDPYKAAIEGESFSSTQMEVAKQGGQCMSTTQIKTIMGIFSFEDMRLEYAKWAYAKCVDKSNYYLLNSAFSFSSSKTELNKFVTTQNAAEQPEEEQTRETDVPPVKPQKTVKHPPGVRPVDDPTDWNTELAKQQKELEVLQNDAYRKAEAQMNAFFVMTFGDDNHIDNQKDEHKTTEDNSDIPAKAPRIVILSPELKQENSFIYRTKDKKSKISGVISSTVGIYEVYINESEAVLNQNGEFFGDALLAPGDNQIKIKAKDTKGKVSSIGFTIVRESGQPKEEVVVKVDPPKIDPKPNPNPELDAIFISEIDKDIPKLKTVNKDAIAVVIGNSKYTKAKSVEYAVNDARSMKSYLINMLGYKEGNILYYENATLGDMNTVFGTKANPKGRLFNTIKQGVSDVLIFYSGHGAPGLKDSKAYFVPVEADPNYMENSGFAVDALYNNLKTLPAKSITFISDACFSGANVFDKISPMVIRAKEPVKDGMKNITLLNSCTGTEVSCWQNEEKHGLFTFYLLKAMKDYEATDTNKDRQITLGEIFTSLSDNNEGVPYYARRQYGLSQTPVVQGSKTKVLFKY